MIAALGVDADILSQMLRGTSASLSVFKNADASCSLRYEDSAFLAFPERGCIQIVSRSY